MIIADLIANETNPLHKYYLEVAIEHRSTTIIKYGSKYTEEFYAEMDPEFLTKYSDYLDWDIVSRYNSYLNDRIVLRMFLDKLTYHVLSNNNIRINSTDTKYLTNVVFKDILEKKKIDKESSKTPA